MRKKVYSVGSRKDSFSISGSIDFVRQGASLIEPYNLPSLCPKLILNELRLTQVKEGIEEMMIFEFVLF